MIEAGAVGDRHSTEGDDHANVLCVVSDRTEYREHGAWKQDSKELTTGKRLVADGAKVKRNR